MVPTIQKLEKIADLVKTVLYINIFFLTVFVAPFSNVPNQWKTKLLTSLDHFILTLIFIFVMNRQPFVLVLLVNFMTRQSIGRLFHRYLIEGDTASAT